MNDMTSPIPRSLSHITDWVFDLDNTLYPRSCNLFAQIDTRITSYVMDVTKLDFEAARDLQKSYYRDYGTTLNGLMLRHEIDPDHFLNTVHAIDYSPVDAHPDLVDAIRALPGRKFILTNGDTGHARSVLRRLGCDDIFEHVHDIRAMTFLPKPHKAAYDGFFALHGIDPTTAVMFDDLEKNLGTGPRRRPTCASHHRQSGQVPARAALGCPYILLRCRMLPSGSFNHTALKLPLEWMPPA
jgi:putative hydrolase of the HAD superfamily